MGGTVSSLSCPPRWATPRRPDRASLGPRVAQASALLGKPFMGWQSHVADVALEIDPATGRLAYREVVVTVPRQSGKTTLMLAVMVHRALGFGMPQVITYTAQSRIKAREKWEDEHIPILEKSPLAGKFRVRKTTGNEAILWANGSRHGIEATTEKAGHGPTLDLGVLDEAFAHVDSRAEQAMKPAMITRPSAQLHVLSTAGTATSLYLRGKVNSGRLRCEMGMAGPVAYFDWSAPDDADPRDPATWRGCMPALGIVRPDGTGVREETIAAELESMELADFRRAYLNQWLDAFPDEWLVISREDWAALADSGSVAADPVAFAVEVAHVAPGRKFAAVAMAGARSDGRVLVEVVDHRPGTDWVAARVAELWRRWRPCAVVVDPGSHAGALAEGITKAGVEITAPFSVRDAAQACGQFDNAVSARTLAHLGQEMLDKALAGAAIRPLGDAWAWDRKNAHVDISPLVAASLAHWGFTKFGRSRTAPYNILRSVG
jgi:Terminase large subunit, T4likevirus-type, N-terminal